MRSKKIISVLLCLIIGVSLCAVPAAPVSAATAKTVYVSALTGDDSNAGTESAPFKTFPAAYSSGSGTELTIILLDEVAIESSFVFTNNGTSRTIVTASSPDIKFNLTAKPTIGFYCPVTFKNITLDFQDSTVFCAGGKNVVIEETVTFTNRIKAFGGGNGATVASTDLTLLGGKYYSIYAGGHGGSVTGNAKVTIGGNVNAGDSIDDSSSNTSPCRIYGGSYSGTVGGSTEINFGGNAVSYCIVGVGNLVGDTVGGDIVINITGGKVMNVYGGAGLDSKAPVNNDTHIYMTGGLAESLFGGCQAADMTGNTLIYVGGTADVSRRIYGGCYNDWPGSTTYHVNGSTTVIVDNGCAIGSKTELSSGNQLNMGLFAGSRMNDNAAGEVSTLIFLNDSYSTYSSKIGDISGWSSTFKSHHDYIVKANSGGSVTNSGTPGVITLQPSTGNMAVIGSELYLSGETYTLSAAETDVTFKEAIVDYTVKHYIKDENGGDILLKTETLTGTVGGQTAAGALTLLGYTASVTQGTIAKSGTVVNIFYTATAERTAYDINCDGKVDMLDSAVLQRYLAEWNGYDLSKVCFRNADIDGDGDIDATDNLSLLRYLVNYDPTTFDGDQDKDEGWGPWV